MINAVMVAFKPKDGCVMGDPVGLELCEVADGKTFYAFSVRVNSNREYETDMHSVEERGKQVFLKANSEKGLQETMQRFPSLRTYSYVPKGVFITVVEEAKDSYKVIPVKVSVKEAVLEEDVKRKIEAAIDLAEVIGAIPQGEFRVKTGTAKNSYRTFEEAKTRGVEVGREKGYVFVPNFFVKA